MESHRVDQKVLQTVGRICVVSASIVGRFPTSHRSSGLVEAEVQVGEHVVYELVQVQPGRRGRRCVVTRENESRSSISRRIQRCRGVHPVHILLARVVQVVAALRLQAVAERLNLPQRFLEGRATRMYANFSRSSSVAPL